ncbi:phosphoglycolate phosphatase [Hydrogenovibrio marinus]|uniref:Phosphoglycolate phosphatase n=1 Tax=Hydrogenovibrio marinus TaxID=28885 RepID=A0A066ZZL7_HYDMR|nr:phosphoglycolate phosphatase [Hydrogenovibrio marinus]KDN95801.1 phosphoglycolate phosphatase [Hydrogenovibrio marinus]BBN58712.1 phosphoglycolate phosphatase 1 [Hydrogenovibrio marinus]
MSIEKIKPGFVLIDLDGTLIDSVPDLAYCVDEMMKQLGMPVRGEDAVRDWVGNGVQRLTERALINSVEGMPDQDLMDKAYPIFLELYKHNTSQRSRVYDGVVDGIKWMKAQGYRVACVTNKAEAFTVPLLKDKGLFDFFEVVVSGDTCAEKKPHPMPLLYAAEQLGVEPENALMIGDSQSDVKAARAAGFHIFCMTYGYNHGEDIRNYNPDAVMDSFMELPNYLESAN